MFFEPAIGTALTFIFLFGYVGFKRVAGYAPLVDIAIFALCLWLFNGTFSGVMTGVMSGLIITIFLRLVRSTVGYEVLAVSRKDHQLLPRVSWKELGGEP